MECDECSNSESQSDSAKGGSPGDGVCPTESQFLSCFQSSFRFWNQAATSHQETDRTHEGYLQAFLGLLKDVPPFFHDPPRDVDLAGSSKTSFVLRSTLQIHTTDRDDCDQHCKPIDSLQCVGFPRPAVYTTISEDSSPPLMTLASKELRPDYITTFCLTWSYILSCRGVEILQSAGRDAVLLHRHDDCILENFWEMIAQSRWIARLKDHGSRSYSPWTLRSDKASLGKDCRWSVAPPDSSLAFNILLEFCISQGLEREMLIAFTSVLFLPSRHLPPPSMSTPVVIPRRPTPGQGATPFHEILRRLDSCVFLSATQDAFDSLACSVFFDPNVPCNLVGSASLGIMQAIYPQGNLDHQRLLRAISKKSPEMSLLWYSLVINNQASSLLNMTLSGMPPISIAAALWTGTVQSFLQVTYLRKHERSSTISRVEEFQTSFFCRSEASVPWTPSPPFGRTTRSNLSLEVLAHCGHAHRPLSFQAFWRLHNDGMVKLREDYLLCSGLALTTRFYEDEEDEEDNFAVIRETETHERESADERSLNATSCLYNWHRHVDDGLWPDDVNSTLEEVRRIQQHPWIADPFQNSGQDDPPEDENERHPDWDDILSWIAEVEDRR